MNKAQIKVEFNDLITIDNIAYHVAEHPALPGVPYVQRGARGFVIQLKAPGTERFALKYFKLKYRVPELVTIGAALRQYAALPGLRAAYRTVFTARSHADLIRKYPALEYGVLMPWLPGVTWFDVLTRRLALTASESLALAQCAGRVLATLEARGLAHCDIAGANVLVDRVGGRVELVDIEEMYGPGLPRPVELPAGQDGYQHRDGTAYGQWSATGDRFGGAVLIAEMLAWQNPKIRENSADEHYFAAAEMGQPNSPRYRLLGEVLGTDYAPVIVDLFERAWLSTTLADCPPLADWQTALDGLDTAKSTATTIPGAIGVVSGRRSLVLNASPTASPTAPQPASAITLGMRPCPHCGAQNPKDAEFCTTCHYHLRGDRRPVRAQSPSSPVNVTNVPPSTTINPAPTGAAAPEIISARRLVAPGQIGQVVPTPEPEMEGSGRWIAAAFIFAFIITVIIFVLLPH